MVNVLSIENALGWSWGIVFKHLRRLLGEKYKIVRIFRKVKKDIDNGLLKAYPLILAQNVDNISLVKVKKEKVILRMGGMVIDNLNKGSRYDEELAQVGAVIATNKQLFDIAERVNANSHLVPNGIDLDLFKPAAEKPERMFTVGFAGNIWGMGGNYKGWQFYVGATLSLYGQVKKLECLHNGPKGQNQLKHEDMVKEFYHKIDCLILPSKGEGCSNVVGEALACGVPVLLTKVGYHGEMLKDGKECLFIERNVQDIYDKVLMLKNDPGLYQKIADNSRKFVEKYQDIKIIAKKYDEVFQSVLNKI